MAENAIGLLSEFFDEINKPEDQVSVKKLKSLYQSIIPHAMMMANTLPPHLTQHLKELIPDKNGKNLGSNSTRPKLR